MNVPAFGRAYARHWLFASLCLFAFVLRLRSDDGLGASQVVGLLAAAAAYVVGLRWGTWRWLAALATLPALLDDRMFLSQDLRAWAGLLAVSAGLVALSFGDRGSRPAVAVAGALLVILGAVVAAGVAVSSGDPGVTSLHLAPAVAIGMTVVGLAAALGIGRSEPVALRLACLVVTAAAWTAPLDRVTWLARRRRPRRDRDAARTARPRHRAAQSDDVDEAALADFHARYGVARLGPVVIVIAAYNEADGIPAVLETLPDRACGLHVDVVIVDDGSTDGTAAALAGTRAFVVSCPANRGQGAALRLGYRIAREHGRVVRRDDRRRRPVRPDDLPPPPRAGRARKRRLRTGLTDPRPSADPRPRTSARRARLRAGWPPP